MASPSRLSDSLQRFRLNGIRDTGIMVGNGAYATVLQYDFRGLKCVGKKIHRLLYEYASPAQRADMLRRFEEECELLGRLHHPNIVQFLGVHVTVETGSELPVLVMEYLPTNLSSYLDRHGVLPIEISYGILRDVALGLRYLHEYSPPIIHRDLSANNVLLTASLSAKVSDLGVAKILNITPSQMTQQMSTKAPGTPCYMPPEALMAQPRYTRKIDSYSLGVMILHVLCGEWPFPTDAFQPDARNPGTIVPVTEVDRRARFIHQMGTYHPLSGLVRLCLSNTPYERPESSDIFQQINTALSQVPAPADTVFQQLEGLRNEIQRLGTDKQKLETEIQRQNYEIYSLRTEVQSLRLRENQTLREHSQTQPSSSGAAVNQPLTREVERLSVRDLGPPVRAATNSTESQNQTLGTENQSLRRENQTLRKHSQTQPSSSGAVVNQPLTCEVERLSVHDLGPPVKAVTKSTESHLHPGVRLQWKRCADAPVGMSSACVIVVGEKVYVGGGYTTEKKAAHKVFQYDRRGNMWNILPDCPVMWFGMAHFMGRIITVGGVNLQHSLTNKVHCLRESQQWEEFLPSMPTARSAPSIATTSVAIIAAGGNASATAAACSSAVEVYSSDTSQWHTADPLPMPCTWMSSVTINDTWYLMGGADQKKGAVKNCWCGHLHSLVRKAIISCSVSGSVWKHLSTTLLCQSSAAGLSGSLVAMGGKKNNNTKSLNVYGYLNNSWVWLKNGDLFSPRTSCATARLSPVEVIVIGGWAENGQLSTKVFIGTLHSKK